jgi:hypothetical protein
VNARQAPTPCEQPDYSNHLAIYLELYLKIHPAIELRADDLTARSPVSEKPLIRSLIEQPHQRDRLQFKHISQIDL